MSQSPPKFSLKSYVDDNKSKSANSSHLPTFLASKFQSSTPGTFLNAALNKAVNFASSSKIIPNAGHRKIDDDQINLLNDTDDSDYDSKNLKIQISNGKSSNSTVSNSGVFDKWLPDSFKTKEKSMFNLTRTQRLIGFAFCLIAGALCFGLASMYIPVLVFKARKFGALYSLGSCFLLASFALLRGPTEYLKQSFSQPRLPVTLSYFGSLIATLYCSLWIMNTLLTVICVVVQVLTLSWFLISYMPGGETGLKFVASMLTRLLRRNVGTTLPV